MTRAAPVPVGLSPGALFLSAQSYSQLGRGPDTKDEGIVSPALSTAA